MTGAAISTRAGRVIVLASVAVALLLVEPAVSQAQPLSESQLTTDLRAATRVQALPADLEPSLAIARVPVYIGCGQGRAAVRATPCVYGDPTSPTTVVLFGDSHASMWLPALSAIAKQQRWRLVGLLKSGCPAVEVELAAWFLGGARYAACSRWRAAAMARIAAIRPRVVIVAWARWLEAPEALPTAGVSTGYGGPWLDGVAAAFSSLRRDARRVIFISDIPTLRFSAPACLSRHRRDVRACMPRRSDAISLPTLEAGELAIAQQEGVNKIDPTSWFCTPARCPVIVDDILVYHDDSHMTKQWARFISPVLADTIVPMVREA